MMVSHCLLSCSICGGVGRRYCWLVRTDSSCFFSRSSPGRLAPLPLVLLTSRVPQEVSEALYCVQLRIRGQTLVGLPGAGGLSTVGSSCPVMSSYEKSPSCGCRSLQFPHVFRDVFVGRLINFVKRSHLRFCTLDYGTAVGNPDCGQRVADDNAGVPKSVCWFLDCIRSTSPEPKGLSNMQFALVVFRCMAQGSFSSGVCGPGPGLLGGPGVSQSSTVPVSVLLLVACSRPLGLRPRIPKWHPPSVVGFCRKHAERHCIRCR